MVIQEVFWFTGRTNVGILVGYDENTKQRKAYIGAVPGFDEEKDKHQLATEGTPVDPRLIAQINDYLSGKS